MMNHVVYIYIYSYNGSSIQEIAAGSEHAGKSVANLLFMDTFQRLRLWSDVTSIDFKLEKGWGHRQLQEVSSALDCKASLSIIPNMQFNGCSCDSYSFETLTFLSHLTRSPSRSLCTNFYLSNLS